MISQVGRNLVQLLLVAVLAMGSFSLVEAADFKTASELEKILKYPASAQFSGTPLREALERLSKQHKVAIWLDPNIDPHTLLRVSTSKGSLEDLFHSIAESVSGKIVLLDGVVYLAHDKVGKHAATIAAIQADTLSTRLRSNWLKQSVLSWDDLAEPRVILQKICSENSIKLMNPKLIPHDHWYHFESPKMSKINQLSLVLAPYGLTFKWGTTGRTITLISAPREPQITKDYPVRNGNAQAKAVELQRLIPDIKIVPRGTRVTVTGTFEDHAFLKKYFNPQKNPEVFQTLEQQYTLTVKNKSFAEILGSLDAQLKLKFEMVDEVAKKAFANEDLLVSFQVKDAKQDQILEAIFSQVNLRGKRRGNTVFVSKKLE